MTARDHWFFEPLTADMVARDRYDYLQARTCPECFVLQATPIEDGACMRCLLAEPKDGDLERLFGKEAA